MNNDSPILAGIEPEIVNRISRRGLFSKSALALGALASAPVILGVASREAFAQGIPQQVADILNFALTLEYLEDEFYRAGLHARGLIPARYRSVFQTIGKHETEHVALLKGVLGRGAVAKPKFDLTAGGRYGDALSNFSTFATLSMTFEDLGVAAYKGQAGNLLGTGKVLTTALQIHSVEARHAAEVRRILGQAPWDGAFDEPKSKEQVLSAAKPFIASM
jgi:hypothetical protein